MEQDEVLQEMIDELKGIYFDIFPNSWIGVSVSNLSRENPAIFVKTALANSKQESPNGYIENDSCWHLFSFADVLKPVCSLEIVTGGRISVLPEPGSNLVWGRVKVPFRKVSGSFEKVTAGFEKYLNTLKAVIIENMDNMKVPFDIDDKV